MSDSKSHQLSPAFQIGILLVLIVILRLYYAWIESQTGWLFPRFADNPLMLALILSGLSIGLSLVLLPPVKGAIVAIQWAKGMHGFGAERA